MLVKNIVNTWAMPFIKDARSVSLFPDNRSQILHCVKYA